MLDASPDGLTAAEAAHRLARYGRNEVSSESRSFWSIAVEQVRSGINILLAIAGILTIVTGDLVDGAIILALIALNVGLTIFQEFRAELARLSSSWQHWPAALRTSPTGSLFATIRTRQSR
jgi:magnesium-transporting ATPase (P-type)